MCIKIINDHQEILYDMSRPLEDQIQGCEQIIVNYEPFDGEIDKFVAEIQRFAKTGIDAKLNIRVVHNNQIMGHKAKKQLKKTAKDLVINDIIKLVALSQIETDKKLEELADTFSGIVK